MMNTVIDSLGLPRAISARTPAEFELDRARSESARILTPRDRVRRLYEMGELAAAARLLAELTSAGCC